MEILTPVHWGAITPELQHLMGFTAQQTFSNRFYLAGGTALALQLGHRKSIDLDFFSENDEIDRQSRKEITASFSPLHAEIIESGEGFLVFLAENVRIGFLSYGYPLLSPSKLVEGIALASLIDIGLMKMDALINRGSRKDFYDLYFISNQFPLHTLLELADHKYTGFRDFPLMVVESMVLFDNADRDLHPELLIETPWEKIKEFFINESKTLSEKWFGC
jgi:hypothetical protein